MKRYLAFLGRQYYPSPGMGDFLNDFDSLPEAIAAIKAKAASEWEEQGDDSLLDYWEYRRAEIYDTLQRKDVWDQNHILTYEKGEVVSVED